MYPILSYQNIATLTPVYGNALKPCSSIEKQSFSGLVTSRTTYFCMIYIEIAHIMLRRILFHKKKKGDFVFLFFFRKYRIYIIVNWP